MKNVLSILCILLYCATASSQDLTKKDGEKPVTFSSGLSITGAYYNVKGRPAQQEPFTWIVSGSPTINLYGLTLPFSFQLSNQHRSFQQPFNQFGITPSYKWIKVHAGYSSMNFSKYTLSNHRFLGAGIELTPGNFTFSLMSGRLRKNIPTQASSGFENNFLSNLPLPSFTRKGFGAKIGYGGKNTFLHFSLFKAKDNFENETDLIDQRILPEENATLGVNAQISLSKKIRWTLDVGVSAYSRNLLADSLDVLDDLPFRKTLSKILDPKESSQLTIGGETGLAFIGKVFGLSLNYVRIEPEYKTMGAYFFSSDIERSTIAPSLRLQKGKLNFNSSLGFQKNNILNSRINTAKRFIGSFQMNYNPSQKFGMYANYINYGITQRPIERNTIVDTIVIEQVNQNISVGPRWQFGDRERMKMFSLNLSLQSLTDRQNTEFKTPLKVMNVSASYSNSSREKGLNMTTVLNYRVTENILGKTKNIGLSTSIGKSFSNKKYRLNFRGGYFSNSYENTKGSTIRLGSNLQIGLKRNNVLSWNILWIKNTAEGTSLSTSFNELRSNITYNLSL